MTERSNTNSQEKKAMRLVVFMVFTALCLSVVSAVSTPFVFAETTQTLNSSLPPEKVTDKGFKLTACDGPDLSQLTVSISVTYGNPPRTVNTTPHQNPEGYVPCNFNGLMIQIQHLINVAMIAGVFLAIIGFCYAGYLLIFHGSESGKRSLAAEVFKKVGIGFVLMIGAWFIVYQILAWFTDPGSGISKLLG